MEKINIEIGRRLTIYYLMRGWTEKELAEQSNVSAQSIKKYLSGEYNPIKIVNKLLVGKHISVLEKNWLLTEVGNIFDINGERFKGSVAKALKHFILLKFGNSAACAKKLNMPQEQFVSEFENPNHVFYMRLIDAGVPLPLFSSNGIVRDIIPDFVHKEKVFEVAEKFSLEDFRHIQQEIKNLKADMYDLQRSVIERDEIIEELQSKVKILSSENLTLGAKLGGKSK